MFNHLLGSLTSFTCLVKIIHELLTTCMPARGALPPTQTFTQTVLKVAHDKTFLS